MAADRNSIASNSKLKSAASVMEVGFLAKWLIPSAGVMFAVVGYIVESAHSSLLGGGISSSTGAGYAASAADFAYDLPTVVVDIFLSCLSLHCGKPESLSLGGHGVILLVALLLTSVAFWLPRCLRGSLTKWSGAIAPLMLVILVAGKFIWLDAPMARIENVIVTSNQNNGYMLNGEQNASGALDELIRARSYELWNHMVCSRNPSVPDEGKAAVVCSKDQEQNRLLIEGEFAARVLACAFVVMLSWKVARGSSAHWRQVLSLLGLITLLTLPYAYGKLLKPTVFEFGRIDLSRDLTGLLLPGEVRNEPLRAIVLARRSNAVDLLVELKGGCPGGITYLVTKVWSVSTSQLLSIREIYRHDVIAWKLSHRLPESCPPADPPGLKTRNLNGEVSQ